MYKLLFKYRKPISRALLSLMLLETISPLMVTAKPAQGGGGPVAAQLGNYVDAFTGDFNYSVPLLVVPGPNGENVPVNINYRAGISMDQSASWIGLGWSMNVGEISRKTNGVEDEYNGESVNTITRRLKKEYDPATADYTSKKIEDVPTKNDFFGTLYMKNYNNLNSSDKLMDTYATSHLMLGGLFEFPDYDSYYVSGPGIGGEMTPHLFNFGLILHNKNKSVSDYANSFGNYITHTPQFIFKNDAAAGTKSIFTDRLRGIVSGAQPMTGTDATNLENLRNPSYDYDQQEMALANTTSYNDITNRVRGTNYIQYFTNEQMNAFSATSTPEGFLDYKKVSTGMRRSADFPGKSIGAFQITNASGVTYHYSLPVYSSNFKNTTFDLNDNFTPKSEYHPSPYLPLTGDSLVKIEKPFKSVSSWKLTAVTGPDYVDANHNYVADEGDSGYWIAYDYGLWTDSFNWQVPYYGFNYDKFNTIADSPNELYQYYAKPYIKTGNTQSGTKQEYYLNTIKTPTHTAFFIKDIRNDNISVKDASGACTPALKLSKIILLRNEDANKLVINANDPLPQYNNKFTLGQCHKENVILTGNYSSTAAKKAAIDAASLKTIEFSTDYSLCEKLTDNINNSFDPTDVKWGTGWGTVSAASVLYQDAALTATAATGSGGKLTLKSVKMLEKGYTQLFPSYDFSYPAPNTSKNPDYNNDKADFWGNYKSDFNYNDRGAYTSGESKDNVDAWSINKITTPTGAQISINYESDEYERVGYSGGSASTSEFPKKYFLIKKATGYSDGTENPVPVQLEMFNGEYLPFINNSTNNLKKISFLVPPGNAWCASSCPGSTLQQSLLNTPYLFNDINIDPAIDYSNIFTYANENITSYLLHTSCYPHCAGAITYNYNSGVSYYLNGLALGYLVITENKAFGGGIRVADISISDPVSGDKYTSKYTYKGGLATTVPDRFASPQYKIIQKNRFSNERHILSPNVGYQNVTIETSGNLGGNIGKVVNNYNNSASDYKPSIIKYDVTRPPLVPGDAIHPAFQAFYYVKEDNSLYGALLSTTLYDQNNKIVAMESNEYDDMYDLMEKKGGSVEEAYQANYSAQGLALYNTFIKTWATSAIKKTTSLRDGIKTVTEYSGFNEKTGMPLTTKVIDVTNGTVISHTMPADSIYPGMGAKYDDVNNTNQLMVPYKTLRYKGLIEKDDNGGLVITNIGLTDGSRTEMSNEHYYRTYNGLTNAYENQSGELMNLAPGLWAPENSYTFNGNTDENRWKPVSQVMLYEPKNRKVLETYNIPGRRYNAVKYGYNNQYKVAEVANCNYASFAGSGFEDTIHVNKSPLTTHFSGEVRGGEKRARANDPIENMKGVAPAYAITAHTGNYVLQLPAGNNLSLFSCTVSKSDIHQGLLTGKTYRVSIWANALNTAQTRLNAAFNNTAAVVNVSVTRTDPKNVTVNGWVLMTLDIEVPASTPDGAELTISVQNPGSTAAYFDDFTLHPINAPITMYVSDPATGWTKAMLDNENFATYNDYDAAGRVIGTYKEMSTGIKKISSNAYNIVK